MTAGLRSGEERGSATVLMAAIMGVVVTLGGAAMVIAGYLVGHHRARAAADLAALSGAAAHVRAEDACSQARRIARQNGATVVRCSWVGDDIDFVVTVRTAVSTVSRLPGLPRTMEAEAHAGRLTQRPPASSGAWSARTAGRGTTIDAVPASRSIPSGGPPP